MTAAALPRWTLALCCSFVAVLCTWAALVLPWRSWTTFSILTTGFGAIHAVTAVLALVGHRARARAWRLQSMVALGYLAYLTWNLVVASSYIAALYGGLGKGVAVGLLLVWCIAAFVTVPLSAWGLAVTGGLAARRRAAVVAGLGLLGLIGGAFEARAAAVARPQPAIATAELAGAIAAVPRRWGPAPREPRPLLTLAPATCAEAPDTVGVTVLVATQRVDGDELRVDHECLQGESLAGVLPRLEAALDGAVPGGALVDVVTATRSLRHLAPVVDGMLLRPGLDGVCDGARCFAPWQLLAQDAFTVHKPIPVVPEFRFGFDPVVVRERLGVEPLPQVDGLLRLETHSFKLDADGTVRALRRLREAGPPLDASSLHAGKRAAERYILSAQGSDGRFEYRLDPFVGKVSFNGFSLARQAGTTLVVCELAEDRERARAVASAALAMLVSTQRRHDRVAALAFPAEKQVRTVGLGDTALATIALLSCRDLVGDRFDEDIDRMTRFLLAMQRPDGGFHPRMIIAEGAPEPGPDPLYAVGQAVFALTLLERLVESGATVGEVEFADHATVRAAVDSAMRYIAEDYWSNFARDFFFMEENWHCLAARASLTHHRHDGYERFCLDYVRYKTRVIFGEDDGVVEDFLGGYGIGNVLTPHNTGSAGFGEASSAALAVAAARGETMPETKAALERVLAFLLHHQWREGNTFAVSGPHPIEGGVSEHMGSPHIRIDYVQHAMAAMGHGGRVLGLLAPAATP